ncbi:protein DpdE [Rhodospirillales bacterium]|nr:protein DpdE [Rhodospirillales bacterium]
MSWPYVTSSDDHAKDLGVGKLVAIDDVKAVIHYFHNPAETSIEREVLSPSVQPAEILRQTRAYYDDPQRGWRVGRVMSADRPANRVFVRFPGRVEEDLSTDDVYVRWNKPVDDPSHYLAELLTETSRFSVARHDFMASLNRQRTACRGMSALISSQIELLDHQINVIEKVLQDPVQRYLLADEVGLGKTIETGVIIRQRVIDNPKNHKILILTPPQLTLQWQLELKEKFNLTSQLGEGSVIIIPFDNPEQLKHHMVGADMIVVDEAHHIGTNVELHKTLLKNVKSIPSIILLTATPVLNNEEKYLQILNLLDPVVYSLDKKNEFTTKIKNRDELARTVAQLLPINCLILDDYLNKLKKMFPSDGILSETCAALEKTLKTVTDETDPVFLDQLAVLKAHVSETYRLDRRILRNRRQSVEGLTPERDGVEFIDYSSSDNAHIFQQINTWRTECMSEFYGRDDSPEYQGLRKTFAEIVDATLTSREKLLTVIAGRESSNTPGTVDLLFEAEWAAKTMSYLTNNLIDEEKCDQLLRLVEQLRKTQKIVIFCSDRKTARHISKYLDENTDYEICEHIDDTDHNSPNWRQFLESDDHPVLVCSQVAEEGLNLQGGEKCVIHFDLPINPNRIEQRIGRLDRFGTGQKIKSYVLRCEDSPLEGAWSEVLDAGLSVFDQSIASLQYVIEEQLTQTRESLLEEGEEAFQQLTEKLSGDDGIVAQELDKIKNQEILDSLEEINEDRYDGLYDVDAKGRGIQAAVQGWSCKILQLKKFFDDPTIEVFNYPPYFNDINLDAHQREVRQIIAKWLRENPQESIWDQTKATPVPIGNQPDRLKILEDQTMDLLYSEAIIPESQNNKSDPRDIDDLMEFLRFRLSPLVLQFAGSKIALEETHRFKYDPLTSLIPADRFIMEISTSVIHSNHRRAGKGYMTFPYTSKRLTAVSRKQPDIRVLRYGEEFISGIMKITESEDRGKSTALWRRVNNYSPDNGTADLFFRCSFLIETDTDTALKHLSDTDDDEVDSSLEAVLKRRGDMVFPGFYETVWINEELELVDETFITNNLIWQFGARNRNDDQRNWDIKTNELWEVLFSRLPDHKNIWKDLVLSVPGKGREALLKKTQLSTKSQTAIDDMRAIDVRRFAQLNTRIANPDNPSILSDQEALKREQKISKFLEKGIKNPKIILDAISAVFLSNQDFGSKTDIVEPPASPKHVKTKKASPKHVKTKRASIHPVEEIVGEVVEEAIVGEIVKSIINGSSDDEEEKNTEDGKNPLNLNSRRL